MNAGLLKHIITIKEPHTIQNKYGEIDTLYWIKCVTRARVIDDSGSRNFENNELFYAYYKTFQIRKYVDVNEADRIMYDNKMYRILTIETRDFENDKIIKTELINE